MIAVDTPGYGKSDRPPSPQPMEELAGAVSDAIAALGYGPGNPVDLWGYHTGSLMALEAARQNPDAVRRVILSAIPYFEGEARAEARERNVRPRETTKEELMEMWDAMVEGRPEGVSAEEGLAKLTDVLQAHPHQWWALEGVFSYPIETMAPQVRQPVRILNVHGSLKDQTAAAAPLFPEGSLVDIPELSHAVFDVGVERLAAETRAFFG